MLDTTQHKQKLREYFDGLGFERWSAIYGDAKLSGVRRTIRAGHSTMLALATDWLVESSTRDDRETTSGLIDQLPATSYQLPTNRPHMLDAGCGTGLLTLALAERGIHVTAVDIAPQMVQATARAAALAGLSGLVSTRVSDLEQIGASGDVYAGVACLDVLIHYPPAAFEAMVSHLSALTRGPLVLTYAPREFLLATLHWLGGRFPASQRRTDIQMIADRHVEETLAQCGRRIRRSARVSSGFYHIALVEAVVRS